MFGDITEIAEKIIRPLEKMTNDLYYIGLSLDQILQEQRAQTESLREIRENLKGY